MTQTVGDQTVHWNPCQREVTFKVNVQKTGNRKAQRKALKEVKRAFRKMVKVTGINFTYRGKTKLVPSSSGWDNNQDRNSEIVVAYAKQNKAKYRSTFLFGKAWGVGGSVYKAWGSPTNVVIGRGYVVMNSSKIRRIRTGFGKGKTRGNLVLHELGHVVGLQHATSKSQLMYPILSGKSPAGFAGGDRAGLARLGAKAGCIEVPGDVFSGS